MSLQESLDRFKRQQQKCAATLSSINASKQTPSFKNAKPSAAASPVVPSAPAPAVKFSSDTDRLQYINNIRKSPIGAQIKRVIDLLYSKREILTPEEINERCYVDINANKAVFDSLKNNLKVRYDRGRFSYKAKHDLKDRDQLLQKIRGHPQGIAVIDLKDAYPNVLEDLQALKASGSIWLLSNFDSQEDIAYPNDPKLQHVKVDDDIKRLFREMELPRDMLDIEKDLQKIGTKPATNTTARRAAAQVHGINPKQKKNKKKHDINKRTKITNKHLPELFEQLKKENK